MDNNYFNIKDTLMTVDEQLRKQEEEANKPKKERKKKITEIFDMPKRKGKK